MGVTKDKLIVVICHYGLQPGEDHGTRCTNVKVHDGGWPTGGTINQSVLLKNIIVLLSLHKR